MKNGKLKKVLLSHKDDDKDAVVEKNSSITYGDLYEKAYTIANKMEALLGRRSHVAILLPNSISYVVAYCSIILADYVIVPIYYKASADEIANILNYCDVGLVITDLNGEKQILSLELEHKVTVLDIDSLTAVETGNLECDAKIHSPDDVIIMLGTSGSTSTPKRVMLSDDNIVSNVSSIIKSLNYDSSERILGVLPFTFVSGNTSQVAVSLVLGATLYIYSDPLYPEFLFQTIEKYGITTTTIVSSVLRLLLNDDRNYDKEAATLKVICFGGAPTDSTTFEKLLNSSLCNKFVHMYGQSEASPRISHLHLSRNKEKVPSVGQPLLGVEVRVHKTHPDERDGELLVRGKNVMVGYYKQTDSPVRDGWLATGDIGYIDDEGYIYITGRKKNIIICSGMNIYAEEVEEALCKNQFVAEALVYGEKNNQYGEVPVAEVVLREPGTVTEEQLRKFCSEKISYYKVPVRIAFVEALKRTYNGKISRNKGDSHE